MGGGVTLPATATAARPGPAGARPRRRTGVVEGASPVPYDFRRPIQLSREHQRMLQLAFDGYARQATTVFTSALRTVCSVTLDSIDQRSYAEYVDSLGQSTYMTKFTAEPMPGLGVLELPLPATMACVDHMLGGPGSAEQPQRPLTEIESGVITGFVERLLGEMTYSLAELLPLEPAAVGVEYSPQFAQVAGAADVMVVVTLALKIGRLDSRMTLCFPFTGLLPYLTAAAAPAAVSDRERAQRERSAQLLRDRFEEVPVPISVRLRSTHLGPEVLTGLKPGDVVRLGHPASAPVDVVVDETLFAHATPGARGPRLAALIVGAPKEMS